MQMHCSYYFGRNRENPSKIHTQTHTGCALYSALCAWVRFAGHEITNMAIVGEIENIYIIHVCIFLIADVCIVGHAKGASASSRVMEGSTGN